jgi:hypothetical protein
VVRRWRPGVETEAPALRSRPKRFRALLILLGVVVVISLSFAGILASAWIRAGRRLELEKGEVDRKIAALKATRVLRPNFFEPPEEGNSWDLLAPAVASLDALDRNAFPYFRDEGKPIPSEAEIERIVASAGPAIEQLKAALRRSWVEPGHGYEKGMDLGLRVVAYCDSARILGDMAEWRFRRGETQQAVDLIIASLGLADRLSVKAFTSYEVGRVAIVKSLVRHLQSILASMRLSGTDLERLDRALLQVMGDRSDLLAALERECVLMDVTVVDAFAQKGVLDSEGFASARHLYSTRLLCAEYFALKSELMKRLEGLRHRSRKMRAVCAEEAREFVDQSKNALFKIIIPSFHRFDGGAVERTHVDLARTAIALARYRHATGEFPKLLAALVPSYLSAVPADSYGERPFTYVVKEGSATIYAWGYDDDDDGGRPRDDDAPGEDGDWVWTLRNP